MKFQLHILFPALAGVLVLAQGCVGDLHENVSEDMEIVIGAKVSGTVVATKVNDPSIDYDSQVTMPVTLIRWDENSGTASPADKDELAASMSTPMSDGTWLRNIDFVNPEFYADRTSKVGFMGWYPSSDDAGWVKTGGKTVSGSNVMTYNIDETTDVMVSDFVQGTFATGVPAMKFSHALCLFKVHVYAVDEEAAAEWGELQGLTLLNMPKQVFIQLPSDLSDENQSLSFTYSGKEDYKEVALMEGQQAVALPVDTDAAVHVATVLGGPPAIGVLGISATTSKHNAGNSVSIARNFKPGFVYNIYIRFSSRGVINAEVSVANWVYDQNDYIISNSSELLTDLSRYGTANSYVVSSANRGYCFNATVKGNGVNTLTTRQNTIIRLPDADVNLNIDSVKIVRSDAMMKLVGDEMVLITDPAERQNTQMIELLSETLSNGKIIFKVPGNPDDKEDSRLLYRGNVKIAGFDKSGKIVWSWHIWITDKPTNQGYSNGYVAMDRNLGAVTASSDGFLPNHSQWTGLYYQFGRKDPIFRASVDPSLAQGSWETEVVEGAVSVQEAHQNPTKYYYSSTGNNWTTDTRYSDHFWGNISIRDDVRKTIYDPCPPGYRVPGNALWQNPSSAMTSSSVTANGNFAGYMFKLSEMIDVYYPLTDCIINGEMKDTDLVAESNENYVFLHSASPYDTETYGGSGPEYEDLAYHFRYNEAALGNDYESVLEVDPAKLYSGKSAAFPVRCVFENSSATVTDLSESQTANSYVITKSGFYKMKVNVRGNGVTSLNMMNRNTQAMETVDINDGLGATFEASSIDRVDVLWWQGDLTPGSDYSTFSASASHTDEEISDQCPIIIQDGGNADDGYVIFYARVNKDTYGNVGIAAYDQADRIIWSWHLWLQPSVNVVDLGSFTVMDRNLGATFTPQGEDSSSDTFDADNIYSGYGFLYQWGRKDPFFQPATLTGTGTDSQVWYMKSSDGTSWTRMSNNQVGTRNSLASSVEHPLEFYPESSGTSVWQSSYETAGQTVRGLWGYSGKAESIGDAFTKTMWDPCPPGYKVMQHNVFLSANICNADDGSAGGQGTGFTLRDEDCEYGIYLNSSKSTSKGSIVSTGVWFPNTMRIGVTGNFRGNTDSNHSLSTATPNGLFAREMNWGARQEATRNEGSWWRPNYVHDYYYYTIRQSSANSMTAAKAVRCQME